MSAGQFYRFKKETHPHTNMGKAALNMMTRTSAVDFAIDMIFMNRFATSHTEFLTRSDIFDSTDTGWITDEGPASKKFGEKTIFSPPLDEVDGAARCLDPVMLMYDYEYSYISSSYCRFSWA